MDAVMTCSQTMMFDHDMALIRSVQLGDRSAFSELVIAYQDRVFNLAFSILGCPEAAEDAAQDAFMAAYRKISTFRTGVFMAWMYRITVNTCYDAIRRSKRRQTVPLEPVDEYMEEFDSPSWMVDPGEQPREYVERRELRNTIRDSIRRLPYEYRVAIILVDVQDLDYREAAEILSVPIGTLKSRIARGRAMLMKSLKPSVLQ